MKSLVIIFFVCTALTETSAVPLASGVRIIMPGVLRPPGRQVAISFGEQGQDNIQVEHGGSGIPNAVHFPGQEDDVPFPSERPVNSVPSPTPVNHVPLPTAGVTNNKGSSDSFLFPSVIRVNVNPDDTIISENESSGKTPCGPETGSMFVNGNCERFLARSSCPSGEWFVQMNDDVGECVPRPCPFGQLMYRGACVNATAEDVCSEGQMLYVDFTGYAHCDCQPQFIYDPWSGKCYAQGDQGTCNFGLHLFINESGVVECIENRCFMDGFVYHEGFCFRKLYKGFCEESTLEVDLKRRTADCLAVHLLGHSIFDLPTMRSCPGGSLRDYTGSCRQPFRIPSMKSYPAPSTGCPGSFRRDSIGTCRRTHSLFG